MKSAKQSVSCAAFLGLMLMTSGVANAESYSSLGDYNSSFSASLPKAESVIGPASAALGAAGKGTKDGIAALEASLKASFAKTQKNLERNAKETELRQKIEGANATVAKRQSQVLSLNQVQDKALKDQVDANLAAQKLLNGVTQAQGTNPNDANVSQLEASCRSGVDFTQAKSLMDSLGTEPFRYVKENQQQIFDDTDKAAKATKLANVTKLFENIDKFKGQKNNAEAQQNILKQPLDFTKGDNSVETGLKNLSAVWDAQKAKDLPDSEAELTKAFKETIVNLGQLKDNQNDPKFNSLKEFFASNAKGYLKQVRQAFIDGNTQLLANCEKNVDQLGRGNPLGSSSWTNSAYQFAAKINPTFANSTLLPMLNQMTQNATCTDESANIQNLLGSNLESSIEAARTSRDPKALIINAMGMLNAIGAAQAQIGTVLQPLMDDCQFAAKQLKKVKDYVGQVQAQSQPQPDATQPNQPNRNRTASSVASNNRPGTQNHLAPVPVRR